MHGESGEFFQEFFNLKTRFFLERGFRGSFWTIHILHYFMYSYSASQFLDESSNLRAGCKKDAIHDAFDTIHVSCIHNSSRNFYVIFFTLIR